MKLKKFAVIVAAALAVMAIALVGCSSGGASSSSASASSASASSASASSASASSAAASSASASSAAASGYKLITEGELTVATSPDYPPFENLVNGEYVGLDMDIAKAIGEKLGLKVEFKTLQFDGIIPAIAAGGQADVGISGFSVDPERAKEIDFTDSYYIDDQAVAVMKGGDITSANADEKLNSDSVMIAVQSGTTGEDYVKENYPNAKTQAYGNSTDAFAAMQAGQANAVCTNKAVVEAMIADAYKDAEIVKTAATGEEYAIVVSKDNAALTEAINGALKELSADGTIEKIVSEHMSKSAE